MTMRHLPLLQIMILSTGCRVPVYSFPSSSFILSSLPLVHSQHDKLFNIHNTRRYPISCRAIAMSSSSSHMENSSISFAAAQAHRRRRIGVIGGGASGMFAATAAADAIKRYMPSQQQYGAKGYIDFDVIVFEGTSKTMSKVRISGGGRCNVMHDKTKPLPQILASYPRGKKELQGMYTKRFTPEDAYNWFTSRGVQLKTESDGRMFPITDDSQSIIDAISRAATRAGVEVRMKEKVESVEWRKAFVDGDDGEGGGKYVVTVSSKSSDASERTKSEEEFDAVILATGSFPMGHEIARSLGHTIIQPVPSLFTFDAKDLVQDGGIFHGLAGVAVPLARLSLVITDEMMSSVSGKEHSITEQSETESAVATKKRKKKKPTIISQEGPLLITHHGVSGPAALRLSAFAAREFSSVGYKCEVKIHFCPKWEEEQHAPKSSTSESILMDTLWEMTRLIPKRQVSTGCPLFMNGMDVPSKSGDSSKTVPIIPKRLWSALVTHSGIPITLTWGDASKSMIRSLANNLTAFPLRVTSKGIFKDEFVTAGGVQLGEVQMSNMQSKVKPGLFMCGEVLDVDGVTGGFNFMGCWSTGFVAGEGAAKFCYDLDDEQEQVLSTN